LVGRCWCTLALRTPRAVGNSKV